MFGVARDRGCYDGAGGQNSTLGASLEFEFKLTG